MIIFLPFDLCDEHVLDITICRRVGLPKGDRAELLEDLLGHLWVQDEQKVVQVKDDITDGALTQVFGGERVDHAHPERLCKIKKKWGKTVLAMGHTGVTGNRCVMTHDRRHIWCMRWSRRQWTCLGLYRHGIPNSVRVHHGHVGNVG